MTFTRQNAKVEAAMTATLFVRPCAIAAKPGFERLQGWNDHLRGPLQTET